tara:strand:+ start:1425 stop:1688 length:264 start_codon:yes stop_codon:yes gene_type:complete
LAKRHRKGGLIQKSTTFKDQKHSFRIIAIENTSKVSVVGEYVSFDEAKKLLDSLDDVNIDYYLENINSNRVLYSKVGNTSDGPRQQP